MRRGVPHDADPVPDPALLYCQKKDDGIVFLSMFITPSVSPIGWTSRQQWLDGRRESLLDGRPRVVGSDIVDWFLPHAMRAPSGNQPYQALDVR